MEKAEKIVAGFENGNARKLMVEDSAALDALVRDNDIIVSLLPWTHHIIVAKACLTHNKFMATTSYVSDDMKKLDDDLFKSKQDYHAKYQDLLEKYKLIQENDNKFDE